MATPATVASSQPAAAPLVAAAAILSDPWTVLVAQAIVVGRVAQPRELRASLSGISAPVLSERLRRLERNGVVVRRIYQRRPVRTRYEATELGRLLRPVFSALARWGGQFQARRRVGA